MAMDTTVLVMKNTKRIIIIASIALCALIVVAVRTHAHCDTLDGPVVAAAKLALQKGDPTPVLKWVKKESEKEIRAAFALALKVRGLGEDAKQLADTHFFETLVRVHRAGEGVGFTGLKPAGSIEPAIREADEALERGNVDELAGAVGKAVQQGIRERFAKASEAKKHSEKSVEAGREFVEAYVSYVHFVEAAHTLASGHGGLHHEHAAASPHE